MKPPPAFTAEHNDTLGGRLYAHERPEERHLRRSIGYWRMVEERMILAELAAEGWTGGDVSFEVSRRMIENHKNDPSLRERQEHHRQASPARPAAIRTAFTVEELERLLQHFAGANDPVAQSIHAKATATLERNPDHDDKIDLHPRDE